MAKKTSPKKGKIYKIRLFAQKFAPFALLVILLISLLLLTFEVIFSDKFFPRIFIGDTNLTLLSRNQAAQILDSKFSDRTKKILTLTFDERDINIDLATASASLNYQKALDQAFAEGHSGSFRKRAIDQIKILIFGKVIKPESQISLGNQLTYVSEIIYKAPQDASLILEDSDATSSAQIKITEDQTGLALDEEKLNESLKNYLIFGQISKELPTKPVEPKISLAKAQKAKNFLESTNQEPINLSYDGQSWKIDTKTLITLLNLESSNSLIDQDRLTNYLSDVVAKINQPVQEAQFSFDPSNTRVNVFKPSQEGRELDVDKTVKLITTTLEGGGDKNILLPVKTTQPKIKNEEVNNLGIKELLGKGTSHFAGSIVNRIYNLTLASSRINGILVPPGEVFSFNDKVGDISAASGYKPAYIIKSGRTILDDGGGVCQDSTTLFRAVLNAGLPVVARTAHAYRVGYYEQGFPPGLDATVFAPSVDFKFKNDTQHHILIQAYTSGNTLYVDLYGTSDGRVSTLTKPIIHSQTPPLPEIRQDDPTLPKGEVKQVDWPAWGANVSFSRTVTRGGEKIIQETFRSNFRPWQAIFLVGTKEN